MNFEQIAAFFKRRVKTRKLRCVDQVNGLTVEYWEAQYKVIYLGFFGWWKPITTSCGSPYVFNHPQGAESFLRNVDLSTIGKR